jgi:hypothetical protein
MVQGWGVKIGDSVAIPEPFVQLIDVQYKEQVENCIVNLLFILLVLASSYSACM